LSRDGFERQLEALNADAVIFNHPDNNSAQQVAENVRAPILNAGAGTNENPIRALIDLRTIHQAKGSLEGLRVAILGNLKFAAEAHSLARFLSLFEVRLSFVSPAALSMPYDLTDDLRANGIEVEETNDLPTTLRKTDVLYLSRIDAARVETKVYEKTRNFYSLSLEVLKDAKPGLFVLGEWAGVEDLLIDGAAVWKKSFYVMIPALLEFVMM
jgi:aspartate carbamoyltransferase catalytic subunit